MDMMLRFMIGGMVVSVFAILGDVLKPESLGGVFAAAPTIALATMVLTMNKHGGGAYVATEARSMVAGADRLFRVCVYEVSFVLMRWRAEGTDDSDRSFTNMVCNSRGAMGALAAEVRK